MQADMQPSIVCNKVTQLNGAGYEHRYKFTKIIEQLAFLLYNTFKWVRRKKL